MSTITILKRLAPFETMFHRNWKIQMLSWLTGQHLQPTYAEYLSLNQALQKGDTAMDQVIVWMMQNPKLHRQYFETALFQGLDQLAKPIPELNAFLVRFKHCVIGSIKLKLSRRLTSPIV